MATVWAVQEAKRLAGQLHDVTAGELECIRRRIEEWAASGDAFAKGYVLRFAYTQRRHNAPIIDRIIELIEG